MLTIHARLVADMVAQAKRDHPIETCGVICGPVNSDRPTRLIPMRNIAQSNVFFQFDSREQLKLWREMEDRDEECVVIYHSHTASIAYPSRDDVKFASEPNVHYVIIPTDPWYGEMPRSFRIVDNIITEEPVRII